MVLRITKAGVTKVMARFFIACILLQPSAVFAASDMALIAHAGGGYKEMTYTNSYEALDEGYKNGFRVFEIDMMMTRDRQIVCRHDWGVLGKNGVAPTYEEVKADNAKLPYKPCAARGLVEWFKQHKDAYLVTDIKQPGNRLPIIKWFAEQGIKEIVIPQVYFPHEYKNVKALGYENIILTLYLYTQKPETLLDFLKDAKLYALTIPVKEAREGWAVKLKGNYPLYTHTVNDCSELEGLKKLGISGIYTDFITPGKC